ncbi:MAG: Gfo/Idh/MocA family oxidoreductase [Verrucomicrobiae bacterium]
MKKMKVGILGCGNISGTYAEAGKKFRNMEIVACADLDYPRAQAQAEKFGIPAAMRVEQLLACDEIELVINLTVPSVHGQVGLEVLKSKKHLYNEKPLAAKRREAREMLDLARELGLRIGCAPDTFLGAGLQTCRKLIDSGAIGEPVAGAGFMLSPGVEGWHPNPEFFYKKGGGPLFDMGPYYLTALTTLLGPVCRVNGAARISFPDREIKSQPLAGKRIPVETPTHIAGLLEFESGPVVTLVTSFDVQAHGMPNIEIYGSEGTLSVPDPNTFGGPVRIRRQGESEWADLPLEFGYPDNSRGLGVSEMIASEQNGHEHRANARTAYHVLDIMHSILDSSESGQRIEMVSSMTRPPPMPDGFGDVG